MTSVLLLLIVCLLHSCHLPCLTNLAKPYSCFAGKQTRSFVVAAQLLLSMPTTVSARWSVLFAAYANIHACSRVSSPQTGAMQILLAHHHRYGQQKTPQQALQYGLIAGFVEVGESLEHAVVREVAEEVNISLKDIRYVSSQPWPFPSNLMLGFRAAYAGGDIVIQEDELSHADFFDLTNLPKIPFKGSIAYALIAQIAHEQGISL
mgnify:CR=1 FL=1